MLASHAMREISSAVRKVPDPVWDKSVDPLRRVSAET
jgi:hypothetical protein